MGDRRGRGAAARVRARSDPPAARPSRVPAPQVLPEPCDPRRERARHRLARSRRHADVGRAVARRLRAQPRSVSLRPRAGRARRARPHDRRHRLPGAGQRALRNRGVQVAGAAARTRAGRCAWIPRTRKFETEERVFAPGDTYALQGRALALFECNRWTPEHPARDVSAAVQSRIHLRRRHARRAVPGAPRHQSRLRLADPQGPAGQHAWLRRHRSHAPESRARHAGRLRGAGRDAARARHGTDRRHRAESSRRDGRRQRLVAGRAGERSRRARRASLRHRLASEPRLDARSRARAGARRCLRRGAGARRAAAAARSGRRQLRDSVSRAPAADRSARVPAHLRADTDRRGGARGGRCASRRFRKPAERVRQPAGAQRYLRGRDRDPLSRQGGAQAPARAPAGAQSGDPAAHRSDDCAPQRHRGRSAQLRRSRCVARSASLSALVLARGGR